MGLEEEGGEKDAKEAEEEAGMAGEEMTDSVECGGYLKLQAYFRCCQGVHCFWKVRYHCYLYCSWRPYVYPGNHC